MAAAVEAACSTPVLATDYRFGCWTCPCAARAARIQASSRSWHLQAAPQFTSGLETLAVIIETAALLAVTVGLVQLGLGDFDLEGFRVLLQIGAHRRGRLHLVRRVVEAVLAVARPASNESNWRLTEAVLGEDDLESPNIFVQ